MPSGNSFSVAQRADLQRILTHAEEVSGLTFGLHIGSWYGGREGVEAMLARLPDPDRSVMVAVDPDAHTLEIVTGRLARISIDDHACALASMSMTSSFAVDDIVGGVRDGMSVLADHGRRQRVEYLDLPN